MRRSKSLKRKIRILKNLYREKKIGKVLIKEGIPFVPSFFFGWIISVVFRGMQGLIF
jgi:prepilin signal peptidase PulO-like enzyme (type II secretory pathway)